MQSHLKICLVIHSLGIGGMERVMAELLKNFSARDGVELHLVLIGKSREIVYDIPETIFIHKPDFPFVNQRRKRDTIRTLFFIRKTIKKIDPDTILSFGEMWNNLVLLALKGLSNPVYVSDRSQPNKDLGRVQNFLREKLYPSAAGYIAQTEKAAEICRKKEWNQNIRVIGNPVRKVKHDPSTEKENIVLTVGRLIPTKHIDMLIRMFTDLNVPDWKLVIVGGNAKRMNLLEELQELVDELGVSDRIFLEGERKNVDDYYNKAKIFAFTSSSEGFPNVIGEALTSGLPVVAFRDTPGLSELITHGVNGFLAPFESRENFQKYLSELMTDDGLRNRLAEKTSLNIGNFSVQDISNAYFNFITNEL
jgi:glycosyltransferase involved in cell wall biosynthesis